MREEIGTVVSGPYSTIEDAYQECGAGQVIIEESRGASYYVMELNHE